MMFGYKFSCSRRSLACGKPRHRLNSVCVRCSSEKPSNGGGPSTDREVLDKAVKELREANIDRETAREILKLWQSNGVVDNPEELRQLYRTASVASLGRYTVQLLLDAGASYAAYAASQSIGAGDAFFGKGILAFIFGAISFNYGFAFISNAFSMYVSLTSMRKFGVNATSYLEAMKSIAGTDGMDAVSKAIAAVDSYKVSQALERMDQYLKEQAAGQSGDDAAVKKQCTLDSLAVYLTLEKARDLYNFKQEDYGLSDSEAISIARVFSMYDKNDDYRLDMSEFERLCQDSGRPLTHAEARAALNVLDEDGNGYIDFNEFVRFWQDPQSKASAVKELATTPDKDLATTADV